MSFATSSRTTLPEAPLAHPLLDGFQQVLASSS